MALDQLTYIRCVQGPDSAVIEITEKDLIDRVSVHVPVKIKFRSNELNMRLVSNRLNNYFVSVSYQVADIQNDLEKIRALLQFIEQHEIRSFFHPSGNP
jgi:hypothetical protein